MTGTGIAGGEVGGAATSAGGGIGSPTAGSAIGDSGTIAHPVGGSIRSAPALLFLLLVGRLERRLLLEAQGLCGALAVLETGAREGKRRPVAVAFDGFAHETGTAGSAMQLGVGAAPAFAGRDMLLIDPDEGEQEKVEEEL